MKETYTVKPLGAHMDGLGVLSIGVRNNAVCGAFTPRPEMVRARYSGGGEVVVYRSQKTKEATP